MFRVWVQTLCVYANFPDFPVLPDIVEGVEGAVSGHLRVSTVSAPDVLPTVEQIEDMPAEESEERRHYFAAAFLLVFLVIVVTGTFIMVVGLKVKKQFTSGSYELLEHKAETETKKEGQPDASTMERLRVLLMFSLTVAASLAACIWSMSTNRLSKSVGLDWEVYLVLFLGLGISLLVQAIIFVIRTDPKKEFEASTFAMASITAMMPFISDVFDTLKDVIFGALCLQSVHWFMKLAGLLSWIYLLLVHLYFILAPGILPELASTYLSVLKASPKVPGRSAGLCQGTVLPVLYKQLTPTKRSLLLLENVPQAFLAILFVVFEGGSLFVTVVNLVVPLIQVLMTFLLFKPVRKCVAPTLGKKISRAVANSDFVMASHLWEEADFSNDLGLLHAALPWFTLLSETLEKHELLVGVEDTLEDSRTLEKLKIASAAGRAMTQESCSLSRHNLGDDGAKVVAEALKLNTSMKILTLSSNEIGDAGAQALFEALKVNSTLYLLEMNSNKLTDASGPSLSEMLQVNKGLARLMIGNNQIGDEGTKAMMVGLEINETLEFINYGLNQISQEMRQALRDLADQKVHRGGRLFQRFNVMV
eukprot:s1385_g9.t1